MDFTGIKKLLIIRLSSLGDILLSTPLIRSIKIKYPDISIDFLLKEQYKEILLFNHYLSNVIEYKTGKIDKKNLIGLLRKNNYDLVIDLQNNFRSGKINRKLNVKFVKFNKRTLDKILLVKFKINKLKDAPQIPVRYSQSLTDFSLDDNGLDLFIPKNTSTQLIDEELYIGFAPGSRHYTKMWLKEYYIELGNMLVKEGYKVVLFGGKDDLQICYYLSSKITGSINLSNDNRVINIAADMKRCKAVVCNDSGLMHVACALKIPVLTFFGSTVKEFGFTPYKNKSVVVENEGLYCRPCSHIGKDKCPEKHFKCMKELTPESAFDKLKLLLNTK